MTRDQLIAHLTLIGCEPYKGTFNGDATVRSVVRHPTLGYLYMWAGSLKSSRVLIGRTQPIAWGSIGLALLDQISVALNTDWDGTAWA